MIYVIGMLFTWGMLFSHDDPKDDFKTSIKYIGCCLVWPIMLGLIVGDMIKKEKRRER